MLQEIYTIMLKEVWELLSSKRAFLFVLLGASIPVVALIYARNKNDNLLPIDLVVMFYPMLIAYIASMQFLVFSIIEEKKQKTLEVLMSLNMKKISIILGKVIPVTVIAYGASLISLTQVKLLTILDPYYMQYQFTLTLSLLVIPLFLAFIGSNLCILSTLLFPDEKVVFSMFAASSFVMFYFLYLVLGNVQLTSLLVIVLLIILCFFVTILNARSEERRVGK